MIQESWVGASRLRPAEDMGERSFVADQLAANGYVLLRGYSPDPPSINAFSRLGIVDTVEGLNAIQTLSPHDLTEAPPNTYSGNFGRSEFPLHTDLAHWAVPPRFLALRCIRGASTVATRLLDGQLLTRQLGTEPLRMALAQPRRPMRNGKQLLRLLERTDAPDSFRIRWDSIYLKPATTVANEVFSHIQALLKQIEPVEVVLLERGDTLIIDNWRSLHGRTPAPDNSRHVDRAYFRFLI